MQALKQLTWVRGIQAFDLKTFHWCIGSRHQAFYVRIARRLSSTADGHLYFAAGFLSLILQEWMHAKIIAVAFCVERSVYFCAKNLFKRNRPPAAIQGFISFVEPSDQFSFPSGHTSAAFMFITLLALSISSLFAIFYLWSLGIALSRVFLGVHFPTDTLVGATIGTTIGVLVAGSLII